jgi:plastocyanin
MRRAILALVLVAACDYPRPPPVGAGDVDADVDGATIDGPGIDGPGIDGPPIDGPPTDGTPAIDARIDATPIDATPIDGPGTVSISLSPPSTSTTLGTTLHLTATITSNGYAGSVTIGAGGGPADWQFAHPSSINLTVGQISTVMVDLTIASNGSAATGGAQVNVSATAAAQPPVSDSSTVTVANEYVMLMGNGTGSGLHWVGVPTTLNLRVGSTFTIRNNDSVNHQIHTGGGITGLIHQAAAMGPGGQYSVTLGSAGTDTIYCHVHSQTSGMFNVNVQ